jgi:hypothetical protein
MSTVFPGGSGITISPGQTQTWTLTYSGNNWGDWPGIAIEQPQVVSFTAPQEVLPVGLLEYSQTTVREVSGFYEFNFTVRNPTTTSVVTFNIQTSYV